MKPRCPHCNTLSPRLFGSFTRKSDSKKLRRWQCKKCFRTFSDATFSTCYRQHKRRVNSTLMKLLSSGVSQRRSAIILGITRKTVSRKLKFLALKARGQHKLYLQRLDHRALSVLQLDDLITIEHTKLKPLSLTVLVSKTTRSIIGAKVSTIPAFGRLASLSRKKYGKRKSEHEEKLHHLLEELRSLLPTCGKIETDQHKNYPRAIKRHLPEWDHSTFKSSRGSVAGQGELKLKGFDPLFTVNHTLAMLRANINRLFRRTWNTTKCPKSLADHVWLFINFYNQKLLTA
jgi:transposase-like protein